MLFTTINHHKHIFKWELRQIAPSPKSTQSRLSPISSRNKTRHRSWMQTEAINSMLITEGSSKLLFIFTNLTAFRSRSLRERTGVDQRLERLPSGPPNTKALNIPWTVMKGTNLDKSRPVRIVDFPEHVRLMSADSDYLFSIEYEVRIGVHSPWFKIPYLGVPFCWKWADLHCCRNG